MNSSQFWAKTEPFQSVRTHALVSGCAAQCLFDNLLSPGSRTLLGSYLAVSEKKTRSFLGYLVSLHDMGKIESHFQERDENTRRMLAGEGLLVRSVINETVRHERVTAASLQNVIWYEKKMDNRSSRLYAAVLGSHHQGKQGTTPSIPAPWMELQKQFEAEMRTVFLSETEKVPAIDGSKKGPAAVLLLGLTILSDWIASGTRFSDAEDWIANLDYEKTVTERTTAFLKESGMLAESVDWGNEFCDLWPNIPRDNLRCLHRTNEELFRELDEPPLLVLMEAPMGEGKTESGMYAAMQMAQRWGKSGFYVALPTSATSNQMVQRMRELLKMHDAEDRVRLLHGMAWLIDDVPEEKPNLTEDERDARRWLQPSRRGLLAPYAVGTIDQAMLAVSMAKYSVLRLFGLTNKVLIVDEIHSYDVYMRSFILNLLQWCRALEIPVVLLSATLPPELKKELLAPYTNAELPDSYPAVTAVTANGTVVHKVVPETAQHQTVRVQLEPILHDPDAIAALAADTVKDGGCICVLMNTVQEAQNVYASLKSLPYDGERLLFHARFPAGRRDEIEKQALRWFGKDKRFRPKRAILVATQVVEQSLDVDFDVMITAAAPIDLLLQRMGRVFRHASTPRPESFRSGPQQIVLIPENGDWKSDGMVYPPCLLEQSVKLLREKNEVHIPEDLSPLVKRGYDENEAEEEKKPLWAEHKMEEAANAAAGKIYRISPPEKEYSVLKNDSVFTDEEDTESFLAVKTRLGEPTARIALLEKDLYDRVADLAVEKEGRRFAPVSIKKLAEQVMLQSVSVRKTLILGSLSCLSVIKGDKMLSDVIIFPSSDGVFTAENGNTITFDREFGVLFGKKGEK